MLARSLAWLPFPALLVLLLLLEWVISAPAPVSPDFAFWTLLTVPAVLIYALAMPFLRRGLRKASSRRVAMFSTLAALLWIVFGAGSLLLITGPVWQGSGYLSDLLFFWFLPWAPAALAIWVGYWCVRPHPPVADPSTSLRTGATSRH